MIIKKEEQQNAEIIKQLLEAHEMERQKTIDTYNKVPGLTKEENKKLKVSVLEDLDTKAPLMIGNEQKKQQQLIAKKRFKTIMQIKELEKDLKTLEQKQQR